MHDAITRTTFAYATVLFAVLFGPQVGLEHHVAGDRLISLFPDVLTVLGTLVLLYVAVWHAMAGHDDSRFARGFARGAAISCFGAILYAIGIAMIGPGVFTDQTFSWQVAVGSLLVIAAFGSAVSALFAYLRTRPSSAHGKPA